MRTLLHNAILIVLLAGVSGCNVDVDVNGDDGATKPADAGTSLDAGPVRHDGGTSPDAGQGRPDSGSQSDAGMIPGEARFVGRVDASNKSAVKFAWQGAGVVAVVRGTTIAVKLRTEGTSTVYFQPVIDGAVGTRFEVTSGGDRIITLASGLSDGDHTVELYRETEGMYGVSTFLGFTSGVVKGAPPFNGRLIEVVGDSISAGYGDLGSEPHPNWTANPACHWTAANSSWYRTYAAVAGRSLDAQVSTIARSGWGMYRGSDGNTADILPTVWENMLGTSVPTSWTFTPTASVVVINLGTNDWSGGGDPGVPYETAYLAFIDQVREKYPDAWIACTMGSMEGQPQLGQIDAHLSNVVKACAAKGDTKVFTFDMGTQDMGSNGEVPTGCDWHPNAADHARMAGILKTQLKSKLGW